MSSAQYSSPAPLYTKTSAFSSAAMSFAAGSQSWGSVPAGTISFTDTYSPPIFCAKSYMG